MQIKKSEKGNQREHIEYGNIDNKQMGYKKAIQHAKNSTCCKIKS